MENLREQFNSMYKIYTTEIADKMAFLEPERKKMLKKLFFNEILLFLLMIFLIWIAFSINSFTLSNLSFGPFMINQNRFNQSCK